MKYKCYLVCSTVALFNRRGATVISVKHYIGTTNQTLAARLAEHTACGKNHRPHAPGEKCNYSAARIAAAFVRAGGTLAITRVWAGGQRLEKKLKGYGNAARLCPACNGQLAMKRKPKGCTKGRKYEAPDKQYR